MDESVDRADVMPKNTKYGAAIELNVTTQSATSTTDPQNPESASLFGKASTGKEAGSAGDIQEAGDKVIKMEQVKEKRLYYTVSETPPLRLVLLFGLQQGLLPVSSVLAVSAMVAEVACGRDDGEFRTQLLSATFLMVGLSTFTMSTFGIRLPIFQGPAPSYIIPLVGLLSMEEWRCPTHQDHVAAFANVTMNTTDMMQGSLAVPKNFIHHRIRQLSGSLMVAGGLHCVMGVTGLVGFLLRFIGPVTIVPAITLVGLYIYKITVKFCETNWAVAFLVATCGIVLSMYLGKRSTPIPAWSRHRGLHIKWFPLHQVFACLKKRGKPSLFQWSLGFICFQTQILISIIFGWGVSAIFTHFDLLSKDRNSVQYLARTDTQLHIIHSSPWFSFPYPGQFGMPIFHPGVFLSFFLATLLSVLDSIGEYNACARTCYVPRPPEWAVNRGIAVEGLMSLLSGAVGTGQATVSYGENIGAIGLTKVASRRVFQAVGLLYVVMGIFSKVGAVFITVPYSVLGGTQIITIGIFIGIVLSNLQLVDLGATRNVAIIGISLLMGLMIPYWVAKTPDGVQTGNEEANRMISILLSNPMFVGGVLACFLDNTVPGTLKERGIILPDQPAQDRNDNNTLKDNSDEEKAFSVSDDNGDDSADDGADLEEGLEVYDLPWLPDCILRSYVTKVVRVFPGRPDTVTGNERKMKSGFTGVKK